MLADELRKSGLPVFEATDANEAMSILNAMPVDVVVTDMQMRTPTDGLELAKYVRARHPTVSVLLSSAHALPVTDCDCFDAFFLKPYDPKHIVSWIERRLTSSLGHEDTGAA
jgi:CheY-like chemotaxis protein